MLGVYNPIKCLYMCKTDFTDLDFPNILDSSECLGMVCLVGQNNSAIWPLLDSHHEATIEDGCVVLNGLYIASCPAWP